MNIAASRLAVFALEASARLLNISDKLLLHLFVCLTPRANRCRSLLRGLLALHADQSFACVEERSVVLNNATGFFEAASRVVCGVDVINAESGPTVEWIDRLHLILRKLDLVSESIVMLVPL